MRQAKNYAPPIVIKESRIYAETAVLTGSVVDKTVVTIEATEQKVQNYDFSGSEFNHNWE